MPDGTVKVILNTDDIGLVDQFISDIRNNPNEFTFYGRIEKIDMYDYDGPISGDYQF
jgi:hypothetical protein